MSETTTQATCPKCGNAYRPIDGCRFTHGTAYVENGVERVRWFDNMYDELAFTHAVGGRTVGPQGHALWLAASDGIGIGPAPAPSDDPDDFENPYGSPYGY